MRVWKMKRRRGFIRSLSQELCRIPSRAGEFETDARKLASAPSFGRLQHAARLLGKLLALDGGQFVGLAARMLGATFGAVFGTGAEVVATFLGQRFS